MSPSVLTSGIMTDIVNLQEDYFDWIENKVRRERGRGEEGRRRGEGGVTSQPSSPG